ncbi:hypothetical protein GCM10009801_46060 [Streptomyces albiaxialis]|uniref:Protein kinase domain-containing protein n=1 Tax=Streptomyces albiaxialis TaxID=329523 RepID=A0ABP5HR95_9ACTN
MQAGAVLAGRYRLEALIGRGGMGEVWRAVELGPGSRPVAIKVLPMSTAAEADGVKRFRREAEIAMSLDHPGITAVFGIEEHRDEADGQQSLFLVMELMHGRDLATVLAEQQPDAAGLPIDRVTSWAVQTLDALAAAHRQGVVHRDIKPANLYLLDGGTIKVCDFGIARLADATKITATGALAGTPLYMAPEQINGGTVDHRTDLYALGCVLYELLTGTPWVNREPGMGAILYQHLNDAPAPPSSRRSGIPAELDALVLAFLDKDPADRPNDAHDAAARLRFHAAGTVHAPGPRPSPPPNPPAAQPNQNPNPSPPPSSSGPSPSRRSLLLGGLGAAVLVGGGATAAVLANDDPGNGGKRGGSAAPSATPRAAPTYGTAEHVKKLRPSRGHHFSSPAVAFAPDGKKAVTAFDRIRQWDTDHAIGRRTGSYAVNIGGSDFFVDVAFSPDGKTFAAGCSSGTAYLWRETTGRSTAVPLRGHTADVNAIAFSPDGKTLATASDDKTTRLWDLASRRTTAVLKGHTEMVQSVAFSPDGKTVATGSKDGTARLWDASTHRPIATLHATDDQNVTALGFTPDGKSLVTGSTTVDVWNTKTRRRIRTIGGGAYSVDNVAVSHDGTTVAIVSSSGSDMSLYSVANGENVGTVPPSPKADSNVKHESVAFSPTGRMLMTSDSDGTTDLWKFRG